jgi:hypothetical protein
LALEHRENPAIQPVCRESGPNAAAITGNFFAGIREFKTRNREITFGIREACLETAFSVEYPVTKVAFEWVGVDPGGFAFLAGLSVNAFGRPANGWPLFDLGKAGEAAPSPNKT